MIMLRKVLAGGDGMNIKVIDVRRRKNEILEPGFLVGFAEGHPCHICVAIGMTSGLEPLV